MEIKDCKILLMTHWKHARYSNEKRVDFFSLLFNRATLCNFADLWENVTYIEHTAAHYFDYLITYGRNFFSRKASRKGSWNWIPSMAHRRWLIVRDGTRDNASHGCIFKRGLEATNSQYSLNDWKQSTSRWLEPVYLI